MISVYVSIFEWSVGVCSDEEEEEDRDKLFSDSMRRGSVWGEHGV